MRPALVVLCLAACQQGPLVLQKGVETKLPDGARITFTGNSHKRAKADVESPLIIHGTFAKPGAATAEEFEAYVEMSRPTFTIADGYTFGLKKHQYDVSMEVEYFGLKPGP